MNGSSKGAYFPKELCLTVEDMGLPDILSLQ